jgi:hypothetical protein
LGEDSQYEIFLAILESRIQYPTLLESSAKELLKGMFVPEIDKRLKTVQGVKEHGYFTNHAMHDNWSATLAKKVIRDALHWQETKLSM